MDESVVLEKPNIFCHFAQGIGEPKYMPIESWEQINHLLKEALVSYSDLVGAMNLVLFEDAIMHVCRYSLLILLKNLHQLSLTNSFLQKLLLCI